MIEIFTEQTLMINDNVEYSRKRHTYVQLCARRTEMISNFWTIRIINHSTLLYKRKMSYLIDWISENHHDWCILQIRYVKDWFNLSGNRRKHSENEIIFPENDSIAAISFPNVTIMWLWFGYLLLESDLW